jgi:hypothetical protein
MKILLVVLLLYGNVFAQTYIVKENTATDQSTSLQNTFNDPRIKSVIISASVVISN